MMTEPKHEPIATESLAASPPAEAIAEQPLRVVELGDTRYTILGTAHVSKTSAEEVERLLATAEFDAVAIELDAGRHAAVTDPDAWAKMDLFKVVRAGKAGMVAASLALGAFQQRLAEQFGIEPGAEMRAAIKAAKDAELPVLLIDRDIGITLRRVYSNVPWWRRFTLFGGLLASVISNEEITEEEIEKLKEGDMLEATFSEFAEESTVLFVPLISERDRYMALRLREEQVKKPFKNVLVVIGAGHLKGLTEQLVAPVEGSVTEEREELEQLPKGRNWASIISWLLVLLLISGFVVGFLRSPDLGWSLIGQWLLLNGGLAALGTLIAGGHILTILGAFVGAPFGTLHPLIGIGMITAGIELWVRKPRVGDFSTLRKDVTDWRGWWRNRVARTLLVFFLSTLGAVIGNYVALSRVAGQLF